MDHDPLVQRIATGSTTATATSRTFSSVRNLIRRDTVEDATHDQQPKGALGLTTLYNPGTASVTDLVFVHGLNGGSQSTWCRGRDESLFWPKEWLPKDESFRHVRIHTFGYASGLGRESVLNIHDFATSLLVAIQDAPTIPHGEGVEAPTPLVLVGHSMGGLVIKRACILGRQMPAYKIVGSRICAIFFLATPHQGADIANTLNRLLAIVPGSRSFVNDLVPQSPVLQAINDEFPHYCGDLQLFSFFETRPMNYVVGKGLIVEKHCAVMNHRNERRTYLDANHRDAARFTSPEDPNYLTVRNSIATLIGSLRRKSSRQTEDIGQERLAALAKLLVIEDSPDDDILMLNTRRLQGAGDWLLQKSVFTEWRDAYSSRLMWLRGRPGVGKSFLAGNVVNHLREYGHDVSSFFFSSVSEGKSTASAFLRTMAYQMAIIHPKMLNTIADIFDRKDSVVDKVDHNAIWRQVYLSGILKTKLDRPQYWVIDAVDECKGSSDLINFLIKAQEFWPLCIFVTSRDSFESSIISTNPGLEVLSVSISDEDSNKDIDLFLRTNIDLLPASTVDAKQEMADRVLERSRGCFLWANLMVRELRQVQTASETQMVLASNPHDMDDLYTKILAKMSLAKYGKELAKAILAWATCSFRPITTDELHAAAQMDVNDTISDIEKSVTSCCGNLVFIDSRKRLQLIHLTAKEFLMSKDLGSEFAVNRTEGHTRLAIVCLKALTRDRRPKRLSVSARRRSSLHGGRDVESLASPFLHYASDYLFQHVFQAKSSNDEVLLLVAKFLASPSILDWIEHIATHSELHKVYQAGKTLLNFLGRRAQHTPPLKHQRETLILERWGNDLQHLVPRFARRMTLSPASIHHLIPPFCPPASIIYQQFRAPSRGINVQGLGATNWDDCLSTINYPKGVSPFSSAAGLGLLALGLSNGKVVIYDDVIFQETMVLDHGEPVWCLKFAKDRRFLASSSGKSIKIWKLDDGTEAYRIPVRSLIVGMAFTSSDDILVIVAKNNRLMYFSMTEGCLRDEPTDWTREFAEEGLEYHLRQPTMACVSPSQKLVAIVYRGEDILLWDIEEDRLHDIYEKETGSRENGSLKISATVRAVAFSSAPETSLLAAAFLDGDMVVYDTCGGGVVTVSRAQNAVALCSSPDGRTLAGCETTAGSVTLYDFETLRLLYRISFDSNYIMAKFLNFTADGQRLVDVRAPQCRVWQPTVLLAQDGTEKDVVSDTVTFSSGPQEVDFRSVDSVAITTVLCVKPRGATSASFVFCGKDDGSVHVYDISQNQSQEMFTQVANCAIMEIYFDDDTGTLTCSDVIGRVTSRKISKLARSRWSAAEPHTDVKLDSTIAQVLCSGRHARLLVSTEEQDQVWEDGADECTASLEGGKKRHWIAHRTNADCLIRWTETKVELRHWGSLNFLQSVELAGVVTKSPWPTFDEIMPLKNTKYFATRTRSDHVSAANSNSNIHIWEFDDFSPSHSDSAKPVCSLGPLTSSIECIVGIFGERLVYLENASFWVCSIDVADPLEVPVRHFFIPNDWLSLVNSFVLDIGKAGEIIFVKQSELAVIKRGLETTESGVAFDPRKREGTVGGVASPGLPSRPGPSVLRGRSVRTIT